jgi:release factor glutamine methyltransferase
MKADVWLPEASQKLRNAGVDSPRLDAQLLLAHALGQNRVWLVTHPEVEVPESVDPLLDRRLDREPIAYILGQWEFYGRPFFVGPGVLVPRGDTEALIEAALGLTTRPKTILDIGTGSGCLAITLASEWPDAEVTAVDISEEALEYAKRSAKALGAKVSFFSSDYLSSVEGKFDLIISNPPYVAHGDELQEEVERYEPEVALYGGHDGLEPYRILSREGRRYLNPGGVMILEFGDDMAHTVADTFEAQNWTVVAIKKDLGDRPRAIIVSA